MPDVLHSSLTSTEIHEPKGADSAGAGEVYVADGAGSGSWEAREEFMSVAIPNVSASNTQYVAIPFAGTVTKVVSVLAGAITAADATITVSNSSAASMGTITVAQSGSAAGDIDTLTPVSNNTVTDNDYITITTDGASTGAQLVWLTVVIERSA